MRILVAEDQPKIARNVQKVLQMEELYTVDVAFNGSEALQKTQSTDYDCLILDVMMPEIDGFALCAQLRSEGKDMPILLLTALNKTQHTVEGLNCGADDYLTKPFDMDELLARVRALLRRKGVHRETALESNGVVLNPNTKTVTHDDKPIELAPKEYALLEFLLRNKGVVQSRASIIEHVWGESEAAMFSQTLDVHIAYLRKKLGKDVINTVPGSGYMIPEDAC